MPGQFSSLPLNLVTKDYETHPGRRMAFSRAIPGSEMNLIYLVEVMDTHDGMRTVCPKNPVRGLTLLAHRDTSDTCSFPHDQAIDQGNKGCTSKEYRMQEKTVSV
jgi:hypothetical protein